MDFHLYALHGFLGHVGDWHMLFHNHPLCDNIEAIALHQEQYANLSIKEWAVQFNEDVQAISEQSLRKKNILMGYSMGGRLSIHALVQNPNNWASAIIISAHPGLDSEDKIRDRAIRDNNWAKRFQNEDWTVLMRDWNASLVFSHDTFHFVREEKDYQRRHLIHALCEWSLAAQENMLCALAHLPMPILWIAGSDDPNLPCIKHLILKHPSSKIWIAPGCGHRVPWQNKDQFLSQITQFIGSL